MSKLVGFVSPNYETKTEVSNTYMNPRDPNTNVGAIKFQRRDPRIQKKIVTTEVSMVVDEKLRKLTHCS